MKKWRRWLLLVALFLLTVGALTVALEPTGTARAYLAGEPFYRSRPLRHWRELLREQGRGGEVSRDVRGKFWDVNSVFPVLRECARDPDRDVRWPAIYLLGYFGTGRQDTLDILVDATRDEDTAVRLQAINALGMWGVIARQAVPAVEAALNDEVLQVAHLADIALWEIDPGAGARAGAWRDYSSAEWGFTVKLPGSPEVSDGRPEAPALTHRVQAWHLVPNEKGPTRYAVTVNEYANAVGEEELEAVESLGAFGLGGKVVQKRELEVGGRQGREHTIVVEDKVEVRVRNIPAGRRMYTVLVVYKRGFLNAKAADYFLDSLRVE